MASRGAASRIGRRARRAGVAPTPEVMAGLEAYIAHLTRWNKKINLTGLGLDPLTDEAVDRLLIEPLVAAQHVKNTDRLAVDVGSGGGSPAIPLRLAAPHLRMVLVESKTRKSAFLREIVRQLALSNVEVENTRLEGVLTRPELHEAADLVTLRAVRAEPKLWTGIQAFLRPSGRLFWFGSGREPAKQQSLIMPFAIKQEVTLLKSTGSRLSILELI